MIGVILFQCCLPRTTASSVLRVEGVVSGIQKKESLDPGSSRFALVREDSLGVVRYGSKTAPYKMVQYFDLNCEHCIQYFRNDFPEIKKRFIDTGKVQVIFKPYPVHPETIVFMENCSGLDEKEVCILFESIMEFDAQPVEVIKKCKEILDQPFLSPTSSVLRLALFITKEYQFDALPVIFFDGIKLSDDQQDNLMKFLEEKLK